MTSSFKKIHFKVGFEELKDFAVSDVFGEKVPRVAGAIDKAPPLQVLCLVLSGGDRRQ